MKDYVEIEPLYHKIEELEYIIDSQKIFPSQIANEILETDKNCGDVLFYQILHTSKGSHFCKWEDE